MDDNIKTWTLRFPAKKSPNMEKVFFDCPIVLQYDVNEKYPLISRKLSGIHIKSHTKIALLLTGSWKWGSPVGFSGYWICLIWRPGFGILKQNRARFWNESMHGMWDAENNHQDYGIERKFGWRWWDWISLLETFDNVGGDILVNRPFGHCVEGVYGQFYTIYKAKPRFDLLLISGSPAQKVYYTTYKFQRAIAVSWKILFIIVCV